RGGVLELADRVLSTSGMLQFARESEASEFIVATENGIRWSLEKENPGKKFHFPSPEPICINMKKITLKKVETALETGKPRVTVEGKIAVRARKALQRMLEIG
ncbi:unnamed protein product, partial [marine sediment metagenome]